METFEIRAVRTNARIGEEGKLEQWAEVTVTMPKDFDFQKCGPKLLKKLKEAADLIGRGE